MVTWVVGNYVPCNWMATCIDWPLHYDQNGALMTQTPTSHGNIMQLDGNA